MAKDWDYALLTKEASKYGGPESYLDIVKKAAYNNGAADKQDEMVPLIIAVGFVFTAVGALGTYAVQKGAQWFNNRLEQKRLEAERAAEAERMLIQKMHESSVEVCEQEEQEHS